MKKRIFFIISLMFIFSSNIFPNDLIDISTLLMRSTFKISGPSSFGTAFILGQPYPEEPNRYSYVLITAAHVLDSIKSDKAILHLRKKEKNTYSRLLFTIKIRDSGKPRWINHPDVDIAGIRIGLPKEADLPILTTNLLANDSLLNEFDIHPGDELNILGFPYGAESNDAGFPILRSGRIASYPLTPSDKVKTFLLDFEVFKGNSGGPVFIHSENRYYKGGTHFGVVRLILGVVSQETELKEKITSLDEVTIKTHKLALANIIHAQYIKYILNKIPFPK